MSLCLYVVDIAPVLSRAQLLTACVFDACELAVPVTVTVSVSVPVTVAATGVCECATRVCVVCVCVRACVLRCATHLILCGGDDLVDPPFSFLVGMILCGMRGAAYTHTRADEEKDVSSRERGRVTERNGRVCRRGSGCRVCGACVSCVCVVDRITRDSDVCGQGQQVLGCMCLLCVLVCACM